MFSITYSRRLAALCALAAVLAGPRSPLAASFAGLGDLPGGGFHSVARSVSYDGSVVVGDGQSSYTAEAFRWTAAGGIEGLGVLASPGTESHAYDVSADGSVVVGSSDSRAALWNQGSWTYLPLNGYYVPSVARAVSPDGTQIVGDGRLYDLYFPYLAFRFDGTTTQPLDPHGSFTDSFARGTNGDGSFIVGYSSVAHGLVLDGTRWDDDSPSKLTYDQQSLAFDVTPGGPVIVGAGLVPTDMPACEMYAFRLDSHNLVDLGRPAGSDVSIAQSVSDAGDAIVGSSARCDVDTSLFFFEAAFVWREGHEIADLRRVLTSGMGLDLTGWFLERAIAISGDGTTIVGYGRNPSGDVEGWRVQATPEEWEAALLAAKISTLPALTRTGVAMQIVATLLLGVGLIRGRRCAPNAPARERS